jgi:hypothetical protein
MIPTGVTCLIRLNKLAEVKNTSDISAEMKSITRKIKTVLYFMTNFKDLLKLIFVFIPVIYLLPD